MVMKYALIMEKFKWSQDMEVETGKAIFIENEKLWLLNLIVI